MAEHVAGTRLVAFYACNAVKSVVNIACFLLQAARARKEQARLDRIAAEEAEREEVCEVKLHARLERERKLQTTITYDQLVLKQQLCSRGCVQLSACSLTSGWLGAIIHQQLGSA